MGLDELLPRHHAFILSLLLACALFLGKAAEYRNTLPLLGLPHL